MTTVHASPLPPGTSPFHVRGSTYVGVREHIDRHVPGGMSAVAARLPDDAHRDFSTQVFLPVAMYDILPLQPLTEATALAENLPLAQSVRQRATSIARRDITGLYKLFFKAVSPSTAAERLQRAALRYFDFGKLDIVEKSSRRSRLVHSGLPRFIAPWYVSMVEGYTVAVLEMAGARHPMTRTEPPRSDGQRGSIEVVSVTIDISWA